MPVLDDVRGAVGVRDGEGPGVWCVGVRVGVALRVEVIVTPAEIEGKEVSKEDGVLEGSGVGPISAAEFIKRLYTVPVMLVIKKQGVAASNEDQE